MVCDMRKWGDPQNWRRIWKVLKCGEGCEPHYNPLKSGREGLPEIYGIDSCISDSSIALLRQQGINFHNTLKHCVKQFQLRCPRLHWHHRSIILHHVDPKRRLWSTRNMPLRRLGWWLRQWATSVWRCVPRQMSVANTKQVDCRSGNIYILIHIS